MGQAGGLAGGQDAPWLPCPWGAVGHGRQQEAVGSKGKEEGQSEGRSMEVSMSPENDSAWAESDGHSPELVFSTGGKGSMPVIQTQRPPQFPGPNQCGAKGKAPKHVLDSGK